MAPLEWKFQGDGAQNEKPFVGEVWIYSGTTQCFAMPIHTCMESVSAGLAKEHSGSIRSNSQCLELVVYKPVFNSRIVKWIKEWG